MRRVAVTLGLLTTGFTAPQLNAQVMASERSTVSQTIDGTTSTITYYRPRARGRKGLFGSRIRWGEVWTPGANQATTLSVNKDITLEGKPVPKGTYSVWIVVDRGPWEMVLDKDTTLFHTQGPKQRAGQIRFPINREKRPFMETLTWWFPEFNTGGATLALQWDTVYVPLRVRVAPSYSTAVAPEVSRRLVGVYQLTMEPEPVSTDTTLSAPIETNAREVRFTLRQQGSELRGVMDPPMYTSEEGYRDWIVLPTRGGWFNLGRIHKGELVEVFDFFQIQFDAAGDVAKGFEIRAPNDQLIGKGTRRS
jgi:hypothetical protein